MSDEARKIVEAINEAFDVFSAMELPAEEQKIEITRDAAMTLIAELEQVTRERDALLDIMKWNNTCRECANDSFCTEEYPMCQSCHKLECPCKTCENLNNWQWSGIQEVE